MSEVLTEESLIAAVRRGLNTNMALREHFFPGAKSYVRSIDTALAAAKKAGKLQFKNGKWMSGDYVECPRCAGTGRVLK